MLCGLAGLASKGGGRVHRVVVAGRSSSRLELLASGHAEVVCVLAELASKGGGHGQRVVV